MNRPPTPCAVRTSAPLTSSENRSTSTDGGSSDIVARPFVSFVDGLLGELAHREHDVRVHEHLLERLSRERHARRHEDLARAVRDDGERDAGGLADLRAEPSERERREEVDGIDVQPANGVDERLLDGRRRAQVGARHRTTSYGSFASTAS